MRCVEEREAGEVGMTGCVEEGASRVGWQARMGALWCAMERRGWAGEVRQGREEQVKEGRVEVRCGRRGKDGVNRRGGRVEAEQAGVVRRGELRSGGV
jgi:hypothetical protein